MLEQLLRERGLQIGQPADAVVCYGAGYNGALPRLNGRAGTRNKFQELQALAERQVLVPPHSIDGAGLTFPILGRRFHHSKAKDIIPILQNDVEFAWRKQSGLCDFFVQYIPRSREYRVWSYRRRPIAVYEKIMRYPERYRVGRDAGIGWNWDHGFAFEFYHNAPEELKQLGAAAVEAMGLDFGAVDIIHSTTGQMYVLEVNTAPGVQDLRQGIVMLADKIARWVELGYPRRRGDDEGAGIQPARAD